MPIKNPGTFVADLKQFRRSEQEERKTTKLSREHIEDLRDIAQGVEESNVGICCRYLIDTMSGMGADYDEVALDMLEKFCEDNDLFNEQFRSNPIIGEWRKRIRRARRTIKRLHEIGHHKTVSVLFVVYGHPDPFISIFPAEILVRLNQYASLAKYTDVVEVKRQEMARLYAAKMPCNSPQFVSEFGVQDFRYALESFLWMQAEESYHRAEAIRHGYNAEHGSTLMELMRQKDRFDWALRSISSSDVIRVMFAPTPDRFPGESGEHYKERKENAQLKLDSFVTNILLEAKTMHDEAAKDYHHHWLKCAHG